MNIYQKFTTPRLVTPSIPISSQNRAALQTYTPCRPDATRTPRAGGRSRDAPGLPVVTASARLASVLKEETVDDMVLQADRYENENGFKN